MEQTSNNASALVNGAINSSVTSLTVDTEVNVPTTGTFRALIDSELIKVTAVATHVWTIARAQEGTTGASHADNTPIYIILTKDAVDSIVTIEQAGTEVSNRRVVNLVNNASVADNSGSTRADVTLEGTKVDATGSLPSAAATNNHQLFLPNDGPIAQVSDGSAWAAWGPLFPLTKPPLVATWTWVNQASATAVDSSAGVFMQADLVNSDNWRILVRTANATPWTVTAAFTGILCGNKDARISLIARDSVGGKFVVWGVNYDSFNNEFKIGMSTFNSATSGNANVFFQRLMQMFPILFLRMTDNGTNRIYYFSVDGVNWTQVYSEARTTWMTANQYGWGVNVGGTAGFPVAATLLSWKES
jgi:hypothetical protein